MATPRNNRKANRKSLDHPQVAVVFYDTQKGKIEKFVTVMNLSVQGVLIESAIGLEKDFELTLMIRNTELNQWDTFFSRVAWIQAAETGIAFHVGLEFLFPVEQTGETNKDDHDQITPQDLDFILNTRLLSRLPEKGICSFLNCMERKTIDQGHRLITQGESADSLFIIQKGLCAIQIPHKKSTWQTIAQRREGDVIGEMALLTGKVRTANVVSESEMTLWQLPEEKFDAACKFHPDMNSFLTELLTNRLENSPVTSVRHIGRYIMTHPIGQGGKSLVYKGHHQMINVPVAIKMLKHNPAMNEPFLSNFKRKSHRITQLMHPNIVRIYTIAEQYKTIFIIMEYLEGESLKALLGRKHRLPFSRAVVFLSQIGAALAYAHDHKMAHKDIHPGNIFILDNDRIKLLDFGLACPPEEDGVNQMESIHYMSPEQIKKGPVDYKSDIYSFGILAYEVFTGQNPFADKDLAGVIKMHADAKIPDPTHVVPDLPLVIKNIINKACAKSPDQRYDSMHDVIKELAPVSQLIKKTNAVHHQVEKEVTVVLITRDKDQTGSLNQLLDDFSLRAKEKGFSINIAGNTRIK